MITLRALEPIDVVALDLQESQVGQLGAFEPVRDIAHGVELQALGPAWSALDARGDVLCCAGFGTVFPGQQAICWALFGARFAASVRAQAAVLAFMRQRVADTHFPRLEAIARADRPSECAWLERIGFTRGMVLRKWGPLGEDHIFYERVK
jgi:hypothetical protein